MSVYVTLVADGYRVDAFDGDKVVVREFKADWLDAALGCSSRWFSGYIEPVIDEEDFYFDSLRISPVPPEVLYGLETIEEEEPMCVD